MLHISLDDFKSLFNLHWCDWDGYAGNQCFDLAQFWNFILGGQPFTGATADLIYNQPGNLYTQVPNSPTNFPVAGDIVVWNWPHVGVVISADANQMQVLEQNDPTNGSCQLKTYNYTGVIGWLHPTQLPQDQQTIISQLSKARNDTWNLYQSEVSKNNDITTQLQTEQGEVTNLNDALTKITNSNKDYQTQLIDAQHKADSIQKDLDILATNVGLPFPYTFEQIVAAIEALKAPHAELVKYVQPTLEGLAQAAQGTSILKTMTFWQKVKYLFL